MLVLLYFLNPDKREVQCLKTLYFPSLLDIEISTLQKLKIKCVLLDIDNTIKPYGAKCIDTPYCNWINNVKKNGIKVILCSNNYRKNVEPIAQSISCDFVSFCLKPSPFGYFKAFLKSKEKLSTILIIGDQFFTDILGGKIMFVKTFLLEPISKSSEGTTVKIRRKLTAPFTNRIINRDNPYRKK